MTAVPLTDAPLTAAQQKDLRYLPFEEARDRVRKLGLKSAAEWKTWAKSAARPANIPASPADAYKNRGWVNWGDWLGTGTVAPKNRTFLPFEEARALVRQRGLKNLNEWKPWSRSPARPASIPSNPNAVYKNQGWIGWGDWFGTGKVSTHNRTFLPFEQARGVARSLGLKRRDDWGKWIKSGQCPDDLPATPNEVYKDTGWAGWGDWLGSGVVANQNHNYLPFAEARAHARSLNLRGRDEWGDVGQVRRPPRQHPWQARKDLQRPGLGRHGRLARHRQPRSPGPRLPAVRGGPRVRALAQAAEWGRVVDVGQVGRPSR